MDRILAAAKWWCSLTDGHLLVTSCLRTGRGKNKKRSLMAYLTQPEVGGGDVTRRGPLPGRVTFPVDGGVDVHRVDDRRATRRGQTRADRDGVHVTVGLRLEG